MPSDDRAIAISATFTAEAIQPAMAFWAAELGLDWDIRFAAYDQLFQQLLDPGGLFARNRGANVGLLRFEDWLRDGGTAGLEERARRLVEAVRASAASFRAPLILAICPSAPRHEATFAGLEHTVRQGVAGLAAVDIIAPAELLALLPVAEIHDAHADELGRVPYTPLFFVALATAVTRRIHALIRPPYKVIALDCDETLWAGICGEDGPHGVVLDEPRRALQEFMAGRRKAGMLLALASKNNENDVVETFRAHPEMPLALDDFAARRINWGSKGANLASLAGELGLGLDSFILVDDNPKECTEAQAEAPEVLALPLPEIAAEIPEFLRHVWAFDQARVTEEDRRRPELYAQRAERARAERAAANLEEFLASLELAVAIAPIEAAQVARVAQLTRRTNQMNATCVRRTEGELEELLRAGAECLTVDVKDRFGSYGLTGVMIFRGAPDALVVDTFLLSCRVLGRGVEHRMVARLGEIALARGRARVEIPFVPGERNRPAALFLESLRAADTDGVFRLDAREAAAVKYRVGQASGPVEAPAAPSGRCPAWRVDYRKIATALRDPQAVWERIRAASLTAQPRPAEREGAAMPRTPLERGLAELWAELLNLPAVGIRDNFFELGGHSLLAVQLLSRVRQIYGVDLSLEVVYSGEFTVAELAKAIELKEMEQGGAEYQELLRELASLSDEEARALLAEEQDAE
ncbi:MAG: HAD-IIIC family phosphatase [Acidobacteriia bacterium]|nr:HAD-IIIC family phosphatase [Terriglobia bacterium]